MTHLKEIRTVFMGTPAFAIPSLEALHNAGAHLVGVVTQPDKAAGRGHHLRASAIGIRASERGIPVFKPKGLKRPENRQFLDDLTPDLLIVVAYGKILPKEVLDLPRHGAVNVHFSLLPKHRGPAPVPAAILADDPETGVTIMKLDEGMDTGPLLAQEHIPIGPEDTTATLLPTLADIGARLLIPTLERYIAGGLSPTPQDDAQASVCSMISKDDGQIDWTKPAAEIERMVRAYTPWPGAWTEWRSAGPRVRGGDTLRLRIHRASVASTSALVSTKGEPGMVVRLPDQSVAVLAGPNSALILHDLQLQDRPRVSAAAFINGHPQVIGTRLG